ncbi:YpoC family protein [Fervidibacillus halotolerans]|uniref:YpoC-like domain-containing protein n=1 Tax=Fervidibacillus halotolerans TaxID=2980027 RepID=A0A9E8M205_9BACI|nr:hypothetical protein [Fervidibacillus halotolerans]WAA13731.1 hypothetical protein OE105_06420 [Fervidibacillus halotolerans]
MKKVPELDDPLFYVEKFLPKDFFLPDYDYYVFHSSQQPWLEGEKALKEILKQWEENKRVLEPLFKRRETEEVKKVMIASIALFLQYLFWSNEQPVNLNVLKDQVNQLKVKPINAMERLGFIMNRPMLHHSYIQLKELFVEQEKAYYKYLTIKKRL